MGRPALLLAFLLGACGKEQPAPVPVPTGPPPPLVSAKETLREVAQAAWTWGGQVEGIAVSPDGTWFATVFSSGALNLYDLKTGALARTLDREVKDVYDAYNNVAIDPAGRWVATGKDGRLVVWDARTGRQLRALKGHERRIVDLVFTRDGQALVTTDRDDVRMWDTTTWREAAVLTSYGEDGGNDLLLGPEGRRLYCCGGGTVRAWDLESGGPWETVVKDEQVLWRIAVGRDGRLFGGSQRGEIRVWDLGTGRLVRTLRGDHHHAAAWKWLRDDDVFDLALSPDGRWLYAATGHEVTVWDAKTLERADTLRLEPLPGAPTAVRFVDALAAGAGRLLVGYDAVTIFSHRPPGGS